MRRGLGAVHGEIPAASAGMTEVSKRGYDEVGAEVAEGRLGREGGWVLFTARYPRQARV